MTLPVFRPLMISATFVLCSVFTGNCRAETDLPCAMIYKVKAEGGGRSYVFQLAAVTCLPCIVSPVKKCEKNGGVLLYRL